MTSCVMIFVQIKTIYLVMNLENVVGVKHGVKSLCNVRLNLVSLGHPLGMILLSLGHVVKL